LPSPSSPSTDLSRLLAATINRLRLIQIDFADLPADQRDRHMTDEVGEALAEIPSDQRDGFIRQIRERFPAWKGEVKTAAPPFPTAAHADWENLLDQLAQCAPRLNPEQRSAAIARLQEAGLADTGPAPEWPAAAARALRTRLQLTDRDNLDPARLLELLTDLVSFASSLDQLVWATWKQIAPKSDIKRPAPIQRSAAKFVSAPQDDPATAAIREQVAGDLDRLRQLTAALISAIAQAGNLFAQRHVGKFAVANIETYADRLPGAMVSKEIKCWRQYKELAAAMDVHAIEQELQNGITEYTQTLIKGKSHA
jgi:hypothetical protein